MPLARRVHRAIPVLRVPKALLVQTARVQVAELRGLPVQKVLLVRKALRERTALQVRLVHKEILALLVLWDHRVRLKVRPGGRASSIRLAA